MCGAKSFAADGPSNVVLIDINRHQKVKVIYLLMKILKEIVGGVDMHYGVAVLYACGLSRVLTALRDHF